MQTNRHTFALWFLEHALEWVTQPECLELRFSQDMAMYTASLTFGGTIIDTVIFVNEEETSKVVWEIDHDIITRTEHDSLGMHVLLYPLA